MSATSALALAYTPPLVHWNTVMPNFPGVTIRSAGIGGAMAWIDVCMPDGTCSAVPVTTDSTYEGLMREAMLRATKWIG